MNSTTYQHDHLRIVIVTAAIVFFHPSIPVQGIPQNFGQRPLTSSERNRLAEADRLSREVVKLCRDGKYREATEPAKRALTISEQILGTEHPDVAKSLSNLATVYSSLDDDDAAEPLHLRAVKIYEKTRGPNHADTARSLNNLGTLYYSQRKLAEAASVIQRALKIRERTLGAEHPATATSLNNLAMVRRSQGNYAAAAPLMQRALRIDERKHGPNHPITASRLNNLASVYFELANYAAAEPLYLRALKIKEASLRPDHPDLSSTLNDLALTYDRQRKFSRAVPLFKRALAIYEESHGPNHSRTATALNNLASLHYRMGNYAAAAPLYVRALKIRETTLATDHHSVSVSAHNLGRLYKKLGNYAEAERLYIRALEIQKKTLGLNHPDTARGLDNLATLLAARGEPVEAGRLTDLARRGIRNHVSRILPALSEQEQALFLACSYESDFHRALSLSLANANNNKLLRDSVGWLINGKAIVQEALAQRNILARDVSDPKLASVVTQLSQVRERLAKLAMTTSASNDAESRQQTIGQLTEDEQRLSQQLAEAGGGANIASADWIESDQVRSALSPTSALIDIARFGVYDFSAKEDDGHWEAAHYAAWITLGTEGRQTAVIDLGDADEIDTMVETVRSSLRNAGDQIRAVGEEAAAAAIKEDLRRLAERIWHPLAPKLQDVNEIVLSPDGALWLAPWNALSVESDTDELLLEKYILRLIVSGRDLVTRPGQFVTQPPVILANPSFDQQAKEKQSSIWAIFKELLPVDDTTTRSFSAKSLLGRVSPLPNTGIEAISIQPNLEKYTGQSATLYKERYALERVAKALRRPKVAAFATHGFFLPTQEAEIRESDPLVSGDTRSAPLDTSGNEIENPLLRCGLLLSGCNDRDSVVGDDDGILTGVEIVGIDFRGTELVVLSACETGIGEIRNGEGVAGLRQAFQLAGAQSVVATLWQVPDRDSAVIMSDFFANLADGQTRAIALRNAQIKRIESRRDRFGAAHPFYWAAWTLTGR